jgi:Porin subfamily
MGSMRTMRSILGFIAVYAGVAGAGAAELPTLKPAPTEHVRACNVGGMTGVMAPGSETCVKIGGYISVGASVGNVSHSPDHN